MKPNQPDFLKDSLFASPIEKISDFTFNEKVAGVFNDMIVRSVPGYQTIVSMTGIISNQYSKENSYCYDLGCAVGDSTISMLHNIKTSKCRIISVDNSLSMIEQCRNNINSDKHSELPVNIICADIGHIRIINASVVILNLTLQFINIKDRLKILKKIYKGLKPGGVLILSEKITFSQKDQKQLYNDLHYNFKKSKGYSELEISQKRTALEKVLLPETLKEHKNRIHAAGFKKFYLWFQCLNFVSILALK